MKKISCSVCSCFFYLLHPWLRIWHASHLSNMHALLFSRVTFHPYSMKIMFLCLTYFKYCCKLKKIIYKLNYVRTKYSLKCYLGSINSKTLNFILYSHFINLDHKSDNLLLILEFSIQVLIKTQQDHSNLYLGSIWLVSYKLYENLNN